MSENISIHPQNMCVICVDQKCHFTPKMFEHLVWEQLTRKTHKHNK